MADFDPAYYKNSPPNNRPQPESVWKKVGIIYPGGIRLPDLADEYQDMIEELYGIWFTKLSRNMLKNRYYNGRNKLKDFGISTPPQLVNTVETVVGWPQKAVDALAVRSRFDGFVAGDAVVQADLDAVAKYSRLGVKYRQAAQSTLINSCAFATVREAPDGRARIDVYDAAHAAAVWDDAAGRVAYGMTIEDVDGNGFVRAFDLITSDVIIHAWSVGGGVFDWSYEEHSMGVAPMAAFVHKPTLTRPFGVSRINRAVMSITDSAVRVALGGDISFQFAVSPQKYLLNADKNPFEQTTKWEAYIGSIFAVGNDENDRTPVFGQLTQASMQQTVEYTRLLAARFASETNVPLAQLGVAADSNPSSAEAIYAASEPLIIEAEDFNDTSRMALEDLAKMAVAIELGVPYAELPPEYQDFSAAMRNPAMPSIVSQADAMVKIAAVVPGFAGTNTFFEQLGFPEDIRRQVRQEIQQAQSQELINAIFSGSNSGGAE